MKMRLGILTFHRAINFGAVMQAYAMQETLKKLGTEVAIIDYYPKYFASAYKTVRSFSLKHPRGALYEILTMYWRLCRNIKYKKFRDENLNLLEYEELNTCDYVILGSDQIWNSHITGSQLDSSFFNQNKSNKAKHAIAYGVSTMSIDRITQQDLSLFSEWLPQLDGISIREQSVAEFISKKCKIKVDTVIDPTFLAGSSIFTKFIHPHRPIKERYLLLYEVWHYTDVERKAREIAKARGLKIIIVSGAEIRKPHKNLIQAASPIELLNLIAYAEHIITSSFHGMAFSIVLNKQFNAVCGEYNQSVRLSDFLKKVNLQKKLSFNMEDTDDTFIDYSVINEYILRERELSLKFLNDHIR